MNAHPTEATTLKSNRQMRQLVDSKVVSLRALFVLADVVSHKISSLYKLS
jgi:hypothetical protein